MTDLYEAGDINQSDGAGGDINEVDEIDDEIDDDIDDEVDDEVDEVGEGNELAAADGGTPLTVLTYLARSLSNEPDSVVIDTEERRNGVRLSLHVAPEDMGRVIGRRGRTAQAIRTLVNVAGAKDGVQASVDIVDD
ncbi:MAG: KH domain-containing protein [Acidimicrobiales bacterium]